VAKLHGNDSITGQAVVENKLFVLARLPVAIGGFTKAMFISIFKTIDLSEAKIPSFTEHEKIQEQPVIEFNGSTSNR